jgi:hypothetical protein
MPTDWRAICDLAPRVSFLRRLQGTLNRFSIGTGGRWIFVLEDRNGIHMHRPYWPHSKNY